MLTVAFRRLRLPPRRLRPHLPPGGGRHAFQAMRLGARVTALDYSAADLKDVAAVAGAMIEAGEIHIDQWAGVVNGAPLHLPFPSDSFDRVVISEVLEHIWDDERALVEIVRVL